MFEYNGKPLSQREAVFLSMDYWNYGDAAKRRRSIESQSDDPRIRAERYARILLSGGRSSDRGLRPELAAACDEIYSQFDSGKRKRESAARSARAGQSIDRPRETTTDRPRRATESYEHRTTTSSGRFIGLAR